MTSSGFSQRFNVRTSPEFVFQNAANDSVTVTSSAAMYDAISARSFAELVALEGTLSPSSFTPELGRDHQERRRHTPAKRCPYHVGMPRAKTVSMDLLKQGIALNQVYVALPYTDALPLILQTKAAAVDLVANQLSSSRLPFLKAMKQLGIPSSKTFTSSSCGSAALIGQDPSLFQGAKSRTVSWTTRRASWRRCTRSRDPRRWGPIPSTAGCRGGG